MECCLGKLEYDVGKMGCYLGKCEWSVDKTECHEGKMAFFFNHISSCIC